MTSCKNCSTEFEGKFCPNCSQKAATKRFTIGHFGHEAFHAVTHTDKGILFLIKELFRNPGRVALEYNAGKRKKYFNPVTFLLIMMAIQVFAMQKTNMNSAFINATKEMITNMTKDSKITSEEITRELDEGRQKGEKAIEYNKLFNFLAIPLMALFTWLMFKRSGYNYAENLVLNVMIFGQTIVIFVLVLLVPFLLYPKGVILFYYLNILAFWIFSFIAYRQFFKQGWGKTIFKGIVVQIVYLITVTQLSNLAVKFL